MRLQLLLASALGGAVLVANAAVPLSLPLHDAARQRAIPVELYLPADPARCSAQAPCPAAILSNGYGIGPREYGFIADYLTAKGYAVASIGHHLPSDPAMDPAGDMVQQRRAAFMRGAANIGFVRQTLIASQPRFDWRNVVLVGHSLGGDSSAAYAGDPDARVRAVITLDNRRAPLPRVAGTRVLSLRAADTEADPGVLPTPEERRAFRSCIVRLGGARHNDMFDGGSQELKSALIAAIDRFLTGTEEQSCRAG